jgi:hypothetical protein
MSFRPVNREDGRYRLLPAANGITFVKGEAAVDDGNGLLTNAASSTAVDVKYIVEENVVTTSSGQLVLFYKVDESVLINADVDAAAAQTDVHTYADLASKSTINPDASTNDLFYIESIDLSGGAVGTSTRVFGYFTNGAPNS